MINTVTTLTTDDLTRLTTLTLSKAEVGEYVRDVDGEILFRTDLDESDEGAVVDDKGVTYSIDTESNPGWAPLRRVVSFTDATEVDPSVSSMAAELRRRTFITNENSAGRRVEHTVWGPGRILSSTSAAQTGLARGRGFVIVLTDGGGLESWHTSFVSYL